MLSIESELRSLRNELEGRNKVSRENPSSLRTTRPKELTNRNVEQYERSQNSLCIRKNINEETEKKSPKESSQTARNNSSNEIEKVNII